MIRLAIISSRPLSFSSPKNFKAPVIGHETISEIDRFATLTARLSGLKRAPWQAAHGIVTQCLTDHWLPAGPRRNNCSGYRGSLQCGFHVPSVHRRVLAEP